MVFCVVIWVRFAQAPNFPGLLGPRNPGASMNLNRSLSLGVPRTEINQAKTENWERLVPIKRAWSSNNFSEKCTYFLTTNWVVIDQADPSDTSKMFIVALDFIQFHFSYIYKFRHIQLRNEALDFDPVSQQCCMLLRPWSNRAVERKRMALY